jgi:hypothetical protein
VLLDNPPSRSTCVVELAEKTITAPKASRQSVAVNNSEYSDGPDFA